MEPKPKRRVAIVGASSDRSKFGNKSVRAHQSQGWEVIPINPRGGEIEGLTTYRRLEDVPGALDRISLYVPPPIGVQLLPAIARLHPKAELFANPGAESDELLDEAAKLGLDVIVACSIVDVGARPSQFGDE